MKPPKVKLPRFRCLRCGHTWSPRIEVVRICPRCKSAYWYVPRSKQQKG